MFESILCHLPPFDPKILEPLLELAVQIAREGREGRRIGTIFTVGDEEAVLARSRPLILDPIALHPPEFRSVTDPQLQGTIKELAQLDGAFIISGDGTFVAACRHLDAAGANAPLGLGTRHIAAASITQATETVAIVVSQSSVVRVFCHGKIVAEIIPEMWLLHRENSIRIQGRTKQEVVSDMAIVTPAMPSYRPPADNGGRK